MERKGRLEMRKTVSVLLMLVMLFALVGCSGSNVGPSGNLKGICRQIYRLSSIAACCG